MKRLLPALCAAALFVSLGAGAAFASSGTATSPPTSMKSSHHHKTSMMKSSKKAATKKSHRTSKMNKHTCPAGQTYVHGYTRKGKHVKGYCRKG